MARGVKKSAADVAAETLQNDITSYQNQIKILNDKIIEAEEQLNVIQTNPALVEVLLKALGGAGSDVPRNVKPQTATGAKRGRKKADGGVNSGG